MTRKGWCKCGAAFKVTSNNEPAVLRIEESFWGAHDGDGHGPTDRKTAYRARRKSDEAILRRQSGEVA
jgi:hypothetical protein